MLQAPICDRLALDPFAFGEDILSPPVPDVGRGQIVEALVIAGMVVMLDEGHDLALKLARQVIVLEQDAVCCDPCDVLQMRLESGPKEGPDHEAIEVYRRADHCCAA
jgi:hypothetical protein